MKNGLRHAAQPRFKPCCTSSVLVRVSPHQGDGKACGQSPFAMIAIETLRASAAKQDDITEIIVSAGKPMTAQDAHTAHKSRSTRKTPKFQCGAP